MNLDDWLKAKLEDRKKKGLYRRLALSDGLVDFASNDYLGLARSKTMELKIAELLSTWGKSGGSTGSRLLTGNSKEVLNLEQKLASIFKADATLLFHSGYMANLGVFSTIPLRGDIIFCDELAHASIKDGIRLSHAKKISFRHNDLDDLAIKIKREQGRKFIAVESIYSMDGDECPLNELVALAEETGAEIILDEAHSTGSYGHQGSGLACQLNLEKKIGIRIYTFGKAIGAHGACVAGSIFLKDFLINHSRPFIYTTAMSYHNLAGINCAFDLITGELQQTLQSRVALFNRLSKSLQERKIESQSAIQSIVLPGNDVVRKISNHLHADGFDCRPILSPTVREGKERIRICLHAYNTDKEIELLVRSLEKYI